MHLSSICRLFYYVYYFVAVKHKYFFGEGVISFFQIKLRGVISFFFRFNNRGSKVLFGLMMNLARPPHSINNEWSLKVVCVNIVCVCVCFPK